MRTKEQSNRAKDIKLIVAYWCHQVAPAHTSRFRWSVLDIHQIMLKNIRQATELIIIIATCVPKTPHKRDLLSFFAAGEPEDLVSDIVDAKDIYAAAMLVSSSATEPLLKWVWTNERVASLRKLAEKSTPTNRTKISLPSLDTSYTINQLTAFWCNNYSSQYAAPFAESAYAVSGPCQDPNDPKLIHNLEILVNSGPDNQAIDECVVPLIKNMLLLNIKPQSEVAAMLSTSDLLRPYIVKIVKEITEW
jgi:hypothetical protein